MRFIIAALSAAFLAGTAEARELALSFDDAPRRGSALMQGPERAERLLAGLEQAGVGQAVFFANSERVDEEGRARLRAYAAAGHLIANHSATHPHLREMTAEAFLADVVAADRVLRPLPGFRPWFRFPFLDEGDTAEKRDAVRAGLTAIGYAQGYVTIDTYDWYLDHLANQAAARGETLNLEALGALYAEAIAASADFYDDVAVAHLGRSPRHVLLLHENDMAAMFIPQLVAALQADGWRIVSADAAYSDPIARTEPQTLFLGQGRVAALAADAGAPRRSLFGPFEEEAELDALFAARVLNRPR
ncbi:MAG TPA: polysaccharide deacetylase family protein [Vitreimonas sp.]|uniref:polysaccharide deacetylase family protein n=1 Tax=Vitreimonas sp. TaxID=3069702 RepID=UPI002D25091B|nr:polysaccharide deacetylase family protein [Vitreimonas sp.]HYD88469.1 polysaccharide deacetylase family protein [Vitreimonas sp.]